MSIPSSKIPASGNGRNWPERGGKITGSGRKTPEIDGIRKQYSGDRIQLPVLTVSCLFRAETDKSGHRNRSPEYCFRFPSISRVFLRDPARISRLGYISAGDLFVITKEKPLEIYVQRYIKRRLEKMYKSDLGRSLFLEDIFFWDEFRKNKNDYLGHFVRLNRVGVAHLLYFSKVNTFWFTVWSFHILCVMY